MRSRVNSLSQCDVDIPAAGELPHAEPERADEHNAGAVQPADLQSSRLPRGGQHGAQVGHMFLRVLRVHVLLLSFVHANLTS